MKFIELPNTRFSVGHILGVLVLAITLQWEHLAIAQTCLEEQSGKSLVCSGDDVRVTFADNIKNTFGVPLTECTRGQKFSFVADFHVQTTAKSRSDIGLYFATDGDRNGDGARSGICAANIIKDRHLDPAFPNVVMLGAAVAANLDGNACRDVTAAYGWRNIGGKVVTLRVDDALCHDSDGDGHVNLPNCTSWSQNSGGVCSSPQHAAPSSGSDCRCDIAFNVPILVAPGSIQVTQDDQPASSEESKRNASLLLETRPRRDAQP